LPTPLGSCLEIVVTETTEIEIEVGNFKADDLIYANPAGVRNRVQKTVFDVREWAEKFENLILKEYIRIPSALPRYSI